MKNILREKIKQVPPRLLIALGCYLIIVVVGLFIFLPIRNQDDRYLLGFFLAVFTILAVKTIRNRGA